MSIRSYKNIYPTLSDQVYVDQDAVVIGAVELGAHSSVWPGAVIRGDVNNIRIGRYTNIQDNAVLHVTHDRDSHKGAELVVGDYVTIGHAAILHGCVIDDVCLIGMQTLILDNAHIESYSMVGAGSLVPPNKRLESGYLYLGSPVKKVRLLTDEEREFLRYSAEHYATLKYDYIL
ncbi:MAG: gamma carbonic anhydrase family protein [Gammaproteobacteria bacterium]|nr:gamma carbonic anhydrase family protein [Gammaproteobacteria bacterium]MCD8542736.1 gamma carbonic anhydrase family protein [Gammaproteobacteria bacterium]